MNQSLREVLDELPDKEGVRIWKAEKWGRRIRAFRKLKGFTQERFAKKLGISVSVLGEIERGNRMPTVRIYLKKCQRLVLNISIDELKPIDDMIIRTNKGRISFNVKDRRYRDEKSGSTSSNGWSL